MNKRDEDLAPENIDEWIEQLSRFSRERSGSSMLPARIVRDAQSVYEVDSPPSLAETVCDLQRAYDEDRRLERAWERIDLRVRSLTGDEGQAANSGREIPPESISQLRERQNFQGEQKLMQDTSSSSTRPGNFEGAGEASSRSPRPPRWRGWRNLGIGLAAAAVLIALFAWTLVVVYPGPAGHTGSGGGTPTVPTPAPTPRSTIPPTPAPTPRSTIPPTPAPTPRSTIPPTPAPTPRSTIPPTPAPTPRSTIPPTPAPTHT